MEPGATPSTNELLEHYFNVQLERVHTALPGKVQSYDASRQIADILPMVPRVARARITRERRVENLPVLADVPLVFPRSGEYFIHLPIQPGDTVLVLFTEADMNEWIRTGDAIDPGLTGRFRLSSAAAIPGLFPEQSRITDAAPGALTIGKQGGPKVVIDAGLVRLGSVAASQFVALSNLVDAQLNALKSAIAAAVVVPNDGGASFKATLLSALSAWPASVAATKAVAE